MADIRLVENEVALQFILAGKTELILKSLKTGNTIHYKLKKKESTNINTDFVYFLNVMKSHESIYGGILYFDYENDKFIFRQGKNGRLLESDIEVKAILYTLNKLYNNQYNIEVEIYHCGRCGRCNRKLTTPESILTGLGPECAKLCGVPHPRNKK